MPGYTAAELAELVQGDLRGKGDRLLRAAQPLEKAGPHEIAFVENERKLRQLKNVQAGCLVLSEDAADTFSSNGDSFPADSPTSSAADFPTLIVVDEPFAAFLVILAHFHPPQVRKEIGISPAARVACTARIGKGTNIHPQALIGDNVVIGENCEIHPGVVIGDDCRLGDHVVLYPRVVLYPGMLLGNRVVIHAGAVIGADGFGYRLNHGRREKIPHFGTVRIADDVEIGANTTIDRSMIGETVIGEGTKIDNLVMIAHNCELGRHNAIVGQVGFAGSVSTGDYVVVAGHVGVADHVHLGEHCVLGSKAGVHKDVPPHETYIGLPASPAAEAMRVVMAQKKLPETLKTVRRLQQRIEELSRQVESLVSPATEAPPTEEPAAEEPKAVSKIRTASAA